jgi:hypothetical protein
MDTKHTPEPWAVAGYGTLIAKNGYDIALTNSGKFKTGNAHQDAARIVACVNNCAGINPAAVPGLVAALERVASLNEHAGEIGAGMLMTIVTEARAALADAKGDA